VQSGDTERIPLLLDVVDFRIRLVLLMGKFAGFQDGQRFVLVRAGIDREHLM